MILLYSRIVFIWGKLAFPTTSQVGVVDTIAGCHPGGPVLIPDCCTFLGWNFDFLFEFFSKKFSKFLPSDSRLIMKSIIPLVLDNTNYSPVAYNGTTNIIKIWLTLMHPNAPVNICFHLLYPTLPRIKRLFLQKPAGGGRCCSSDTTEISVATLSTRHNGNVWN